jgi:HPt (histidine-containing phosphotransfer) domain-containing protein
MADEQKQVEETSSAEEFGKPIETNAFGITGVENLPKSNDPESPEVPEEKPVVPASSVEKMKELTAEGAEGKPTQTQEAKDALLEQLKSKSPEFAAICEKKGIKDAAQAFKIYADQEAEFTKRSALLNDYKETMKPYFTFDENGKLNGLTELGKKLKESEKPLETNKNINPEISSENLSQLAPEFWEQFEKNPVDTLVKIIQAVGNFGGNKHKDEFSKAIADLRGELKPYFDEQETKKSKSIIDEVIKEKVASGDNTANEFFTKYASEIQAELNKITPETFKANPKQAIEQAHTIVKAAKIMEFQKLMLKKQEDERAAAAAASNTGTGSNSPVQPDVDPEIAEMQEVLKSRTASAFFN